MNKADKFTLLAFTIVGLAIGACNKQQKQEGNSNFNRAAMLQNYSANIIIPSFKLATDHAQKLQTQVLAFHANPQKEQFGQILNQWQDLAIAWQNCNAFNFGPAAESGIKKSLTEEIATFPVNETKILSYINKADTSFANFDRDSRGLYAIEFLLFGSNQDSAFRYLQTDANRRTYLLAIINHFTAMISEVSLAWQDYQTLFNSNTGTDIGSSVSLLYNEFLKSFEACKNYKFGIPLGRRPGQTTPLPASVEGYYSKLSTKLAQTHWNQIRNIWEGRGTTDGLGFKEYLQTVTGGENLVNLTMQQEANIQQLMNGLPDQGLDITINNNFNQVDAIHTEMQKNTRFYKSDLSSLIGIAITYSSGDGD